MLNWIFISQCLVLLIVKFSISTKMNFLCQLGLLYIWFVHCTSLLSAKGLNNIKMANNKKKLILYLGFMGLPGCNVKWNAGIKFVICHTYKWCSYNTSILESCNIQTICQVQRILQTFYDIPFYHVLYTGIPIQYKL